MFLITSILGVREAKITEIKKKDHLIKTVILSIK